MENPQSFGLIDVRLSSFIRQKFPASSKLFGDLGIVLVRSDLCNLSAFKLGPDHECIHRALDVVQLVLFGLKRN